MTLYKDPDNCPPWWPDKLEYSHKSLFRLGDFDSWGLETTTLETMPEVLKNALTAECMLDAVNQVSLFIIS